MGTRLQLGDLEVDVVLKQIKNVHLSVHPPTGRVRIAAPSRMDMNTIRAFAISKLGWIRRHQKQLQTQEREAARDYVERETHYVWGHRHLLQIEPTAGRSGIEVQHSTIVMRVGPETSTRRRHALMQAWYRRLLKEAIAPLCARWAPIVGVEPKAVAVWRMKTRWGSCSPRRKTVRVNLELVKKPPKCLEYILVHELVHLLEPTHNERFIKHLDRLLPHWRQLRAELNQAPLGHVTWEY